jgi:hypothetical protein
MISVCTLILATTMFLVTPPAREEEEPLLGEPLTVSLIWIRRRIATEEGSKRGNARQETDQQRVGLRVGYFLSVQ